MTKHNILLITTDQMRYDALGCNGGQVARTPVIDGLAAAGINYRRAHNQHVVCMPARATIITGQHAATHGVWMNGASLSPDRPTVAHLLQEAGYATGIFGKAHFEPWLGDPVMFDENRMASEGRFGPHRGFDHMELANHWFEGHSHYDRWMELNHWDMKQRFYPMVSGRGQSVVSSSESGAPQVWPTDIPRELYHTDWVADRTNDWLSGLPDQPFFCWMSFPDPHHPWDPPASEIGRVDWREVPLPQLYPEQRRERERLLDDKPVHWRGYYEGTVWNNMESPRDFLPRDMTAEQVREINALTHVENELIDEACGRVLACLDAQGKLEDTDIFFTTDHGELQGDFGLLFKGPYHVDALMRLPFIWSPSGSKASAEVTSPVGHVDLAPTFCNIAGIPVPEWMDGKPLPTSEAEATGCEWVLTEWDSEHHEVETHLRSIYHREGWLLTTYEPGTLFEGTEGELYDMNDDPLQTRNRWNDPALSELKSDLKAALYDALPRGEGLRLPRYANV